MSMIKMTTKTIEVKENSTKWKAYLEIMEEHNKECKGTK